MYDVTVTAILLLALVFSTAVSVVNKVTIRALFITMLEKRAKGYCNVDFHVK